MKHHHALFSIATKQNYFCNLGLVDRGLRFIIAVFSIAPILMVVDSVTWNSYTALLGIYLTVTAIMGWDPLYSLFRITSTTADLVIGMLLIKSERSHNGEPSA